MGLVTVILAAGPGKRMQSRLHKVLHVAGGRPMVEHVVRAARGLGEGRVLLVVGYQAEAVKAAVGPAVDYVTQGEPLGTGHAVMQVEAALRPDEDQLLVLTGDTPLLTAEVLRQLVAEHMAAGNAATLLTARVENPAGYGRVVRSAGGQILRIVEDRDANPEELAINEINPSIYCFAREALFPALRQTGRGNAQGEYYLTDVIEILLRQGRRVGAVAATDETAVQGVNNRRQLAEADRILRLRTLGRLMDAGVTILDPASTFIDPDVEIGRDTVVLPFSTLRGATRAGQDCRIGPLAHVVDSRFGDGVVVEYSSVEGSHLEDGVHVGPFAHLRAGTVVETGARVGNFAELKNARLGPGSKVPHHSYVGDATIGAQANVGAGAVFVNFDGRRKRHTEVGAGAFIGCNANLIAPLRVGEGAFVAAGSTVNQDIPPDALAIARSRQENREGWAARRRGAGKTTPAHEG